MKCGTDNIPYPDQYDEYIKQAMDDLAKEMDFAVLSDLYIKTGWTLIALERFVNNKQAVDIQDWLFKNCVGKFDNHGSKFIFERKQDAEWFLLRWQ